MTLIHTELLRKGSANTHSRTYGGQEDPMKYKHIVFDVDGTLINTSENILCSLQQALKTTDGFCYNISELTFSLGCTSVVTLDRLKASDPDATLTVWIENERKNAHMICLFDGILELLDCLKEQGCLLGIVTSRTHEELDLVFNTVPIRSYFDTIICSDDVESPKPAPDPLIKYMEITGVSRQDIVYIGDTQHDMNCACNAGIDHILAVWGTHDKGVTADHLPETPSELYSILLK